MSIIGYGIFEMMSVLIFVLVIGVFVVTIGKGISQWNKNNHSPILDVEATVISRRADVTRHTHHHGNSNIPHHSYSTNYYVTFEFQSGDRMELHVPDQDYGMMIEGDHGILRFQGTRFLSFDRHY